MLDFIRLVTDVARDVPTKQLILFLHNQSGKKIVLKDLVSDESPCKIKGSAA